ncbi:unnamed protein product [Ectocarpus sp. 4 AP-2014]
MSYASPVRSRWSSAASFGTLLRLATLSTGIVRCGAWLAVGPRGRASSISAFVGSNSAVARPRKTSVNSMAASPLMEGAGNHIQRVDTLETERALVSKYEAFVFDCDGVLWGGSHAIEGSLDTVKALRRAGKRTFFVTNNSSKSRRQYCVKLEGFGVHGVGVEDIVTSGSAIAAYVKLSHPDVRTVYMIGEEGLEEELEMVGLMVVKEDARPAPGMTEDEFRENITDPEVGAVVVGLDTSFGFRQLCVASSYIQSGAHFLGTNPDVADRVGSLLMPGTGPMLASIQAASGVAPVVVGKPNPLLIRQLMDQNGLAASKTLMVGDRLDTDIMFGNAGGVSSALVLTGVSEMSDVVGLQAGGDKTPTYLLERLGALLPAATEAAEAATETSAVAKM